MGIVIRKLGVCAPMRRLCSSEVCHQTSPKSSLRFFLKVQKCSCMFEQLVNHNSGLAKGDFILVVTNCIAYYIQRCLQQQFQHCSLNGTKQITGEGDNTLL